MLERATATERIYAGLKADLLDGRFAPGERLDSGALAMRFSASITPVREALHRLTGERLVDALPNDGFHSPRLTEAALRELYDWNHRLALQALRHQRKNRDEVGEIPATLEFDSDPVLATEQLFAAIAEFGGNAELKAAVRSASERLRVVRRGKIDMLPDIIDELAALLAVISIERMPRIERALLDYHKRRCAIVPRLVQQLCA